MFIHLDKSIINKLRKKLTDGIWFDNFVKELKRLVQWEI